MKKRFMSILLVLSMLFSFLPTTILTAHAEAELISDLQITVNKDGTIKDNKIVVTPTSDVSKRMPTYILIMSTESFDDDGTSDDIVTDFDTLSGEMMARDLMSLTNPAFLFVLETYDTPGNPYDAELVTSNEEMISGMFETYSGTYGYNVDCLNAIAQEINSAEVLEYKNGDSYNLQAYIFNGDNVDEDSGLQIIPIEITIYGGEPSDTKTITAVNVGDGFHALTNGGDIEPEELTNPTGTVDGDEDDGAIGTTTVKWEKEGSSASSPASPGTYTVTITMEAAEGYEFDDSIDENAIEGLEGCDPGSITASVEDGKLTITATYTVTATDEVITAIKGNVTAPAVKTAPASNASGVQVSSNGLDYAPETGMTPALTWSPDTRVGSNFAAGVEYTVTFNVTAPSGYKFDTGTAVSYPLPTGAKSATVVVNDANSATVTITYNAIAKTVDSIKRTGSLESTDLTVGDAYTTEKFPEITITYNDGSTVTATGSAQYASNHLEVDATAIPGVDSKGNVTGQTVTAAGGPYQVNVTYTGNDKTPDGTGPYTVQIEEVNITNAPLGDVTVKAELPNVGETEDSTDVKSATLAGDSTTGLAPLDSGVSIEWFTDRDCKKAVNGAKFQYGSYYYAKVTVSADANYVFNDNMTITLVNVDTGDEYGETTTVIDSTAQPGNDASDGAKTDMYAVFEVKVTSAPSIASVEPSPYDYATSTDGVKITLSKALVGGLNGSDIYIGGEYGPSNLDGTKVAASLGDDHKTITITDTNIRTFLKTVWNSGNELTKPYSLQKWTIKIPIENSGSPIQGQEKFQAQNTLPYLTITQATGGTISVSGTGATKVSGDASPEVYQLKAGETYTISTTETGDYKFKSWTWSASDGATLSPDNNTSPATFSAAVSGVYSITATYSSPSTLTVTATNGTIDSVKDNGVDATAGTGTGEYKMYPGHTYVVTVSPNADFKFDPAGAWSVNGVTGGTDGGQATARTYTFTAPDEGNVTVAANIVEDYKTVTFNITGNGTVSMSNNATTNATSGTAYRIKPSDGTVTITATAAEGYKLTTLDSAISATGSSTMTVSYDNITPGDNKNITVVFEEKVKPAWITDDNHTAAGSKHQKNMGLKSFVFEHTASDDYTLNTSGITVKTATGTNKFTPTSGWLSGAKLTISPENLNNLEPGVYTVTFPFTDVIGNGPAHELTITFEITSEPKITAVILPDNLVHGDNMGTFGFTVGNILTEGGSATSKTYTYTASTGTWDSDPPSGVYVSVSGSQMPLDDFLTKYVKTGTIVRYKAKSGVGAGVAATLCNTDTISAGMGSTFCDGKKLTVTQKPIKLVPSDGKSFVRPYDTTTATAALSWTVSGEDMIDDDKTALGTTFASPNAAITVVGNYYNSGKTATDKNAGAGKPIKFTITPQTSTYPDVENYTFSADDTTGEITRIKITVPGSAFSPVPAGKYGEETEGNSTLSGYKGEGVVDADGIDINYHYKYHANEDKADISGATTTPDNYEITVDGPADGSREERAVATITVTPFYSPYADSNSETTTFYSSDLVDAKITINYDDGKDSKVYNNIAAAVADGVQVSLNNGTTYADASKKDGAFNVVRADNGKNIVASFKGKTGYQAITVNQIPVKVTVSTADNTISKTYDRTTNYGGALTYAIAVDTARMSDAKGSGYSAGDITASGATVAFTTENKHHYKKTGTGTGEAGVEYKDSVATLSGVVSLADGTTGTNTKASEYTISETVLGITEAEITALPITVTKIDYIEPVRVNSVGVNNGTAIASSATEADKTSGYKAIATVAGENNAKAIAEADKLLFEITSEYDDTSVASSATNDAEVSLHTVKLADANGTKNANYSFTPLTSKEEAVGVDGHGTVTESTVQEITLSLPTILHGSGNAKAGVKTYGDTDTLAFTGAHYNGLTVVVKYDDTDQDTYEFTTISNGNYGWTVNSDSTIAFSEAPFTLTWSGSVVTGALTPGNTIKWTYTTNTVLTAEIGTATKKQDTATVTVNKKKLTVTPSYANDGSNKPTKNYDKTTTIVPAGTWTYSVEGGVEGDGISVAPKAKPVYSQSDASTSDIAITFSGKADWTITSTLSDDTKTRVEGSYEIETVNAVTGVINKRPLTLESIIWIPSVQQFVNHTAATTTATSNSNAANSVAIFTTKTTDTGIVDGDTITVNYTYQYTDTKTPRTVEDLTLVITGVSLASPTNNYELNPVDPTTLDGLVRQGTVTAVAISSIDVTSPTIHTASQTANAVQYGDKYSYAGLAVTVTYDGGMTVTYTPVAYDNLEGNWEAEYSDSTPDATVAYDDIPFTLSGNGIAQGADLLTVNTDGYNVITATEKKESGKSGSTASLKVYPRQVAVAASGEITKEYDGTTAYGSSSGDITYTLSCTPTSYNADYELPTTLKASALTSNITYRTKNAGSTQADITGIALGTTAEDVLTNYALVNDTSSVDAEITQKSVTIEKINWITAVNQGQKTDLTKSIDVQTTDLSASKAAWAKVSDSTPVAGSDVLDLTVNYTYENTDVASTGDGNDIPVKINSVVAKEGTNTATNYIIVATDTTGTGTVTAANYKVTVTNPSQDEYTFGDELNIDGLTVTIENESVAEDKTTYVAKKADDGTIEWHEGTANGPKVANPPFDIEWVNGDKITEPDKTVTPDQQLPPSKFNEAQIQATLKDGMQGNPGVGDKFTVNKKPLTVKANKKATITKEYNGNTSLATGENGTSSIEYDLVGEIEGYPATFSPSVTPAYKSKNANDSIDIEFTITEKKEDDNYILNTNATVTEYNSDELGDIKGAITAKKVTVTKVYIRQVVANADASDDREEKVENATHAASPTATHVVAAGFIDGEASHYIFGYTIVYKKEALQNVSGIPKAFVTLKPDSTSFASSDELNYPLANYTVDWTTIKQRSDKSNEKLQAGNYGYQSGDGEEGTYLIGQISGDSYTELSVADPTKLTYIHGETLDLSGLKVTFKSTNVSGGATYEITGEPGSQQWKLSGGDPVETLPTGITVQIELDNDKEPLDLSSTDALKDLQAHYSDMGKVAGKPIIIAAEPSSTDLTKTTANIKVSQKELNVTANAETFDKYYDGNNTVNNVTFGVTDSDLVTFKNPAQFTTPNADSNYKDVVTVASSSKATYENANVKGTAADPQPHTISFAAVTLDGADAANYTPKYPTQTGTIKPRTVIVNEFGNNVKANDATYNKPNTATGTVNNIAGTTGSVVGSYTYTAKTNPEGAWPEGLDAPTIKVGYNYGDYVTTTKGDVQLKNADTTHGDSFSVELIRDEDKKNFILDTTAVTYLNGYVSLDEVTAITVDKTKKDFFYGDTLKDDELGDLTITIGDDSFKYYENGKVNQDKLDIYNLEIVVTNEDGTTLDRANGVLKDGNTQAKITVKVKNKDVSGSVNITVDKRTLVAKPNLAPDAKITKVYDGNSNAPAITFVLETKENQKSTTGDNTGYGLSTGDEETATADYTKAFNVTAPSTIQYIKSAGVQPAEPAKDAGENYPLQYSNDAGLTAGSVTANMDQYNVVLTGMTGDITPKPVTLIPNIPSDYPGNGSADKDISGTAYTVGEGTSFVEGEQSHYALSYSAKLTADKYKVANTYPFAPAAAKGTDESTKYESVAAQDNTTYYWHITANDGYKLTNYTFTLGNAQVVIANKVITGATITQSPTKKNYLVNVAGENTLALAGLKVKLSYADGLDDEEFEFGTDNWPEGFEVYVAPRGEDEINDGKTLVITDDGTTYRVKVSDSMYTDNATDPISVKAQLKVTATNIKKDYDGNANVTNVTYVLTEDSKSTLNGIAGAGTDENVSITASNISGTYQINSASLPAAYAGTKPVQFATSDATSFTLGGVNGADRFVLVWDTDTAATINGTIDKLTVTVTSLPVATTSKNVNADADVEVEGTLTGDKINDHIAAIPGAIWNTDKANFTATWTAVFTANQVKTEHTGLPAFAITYKNNTKPVVTAYGDPDVFATNYTFEWPENPTGMLEGKAGVIENISYPTSVIHGNAYDYNGTKFTIKEKGDDTNATAYTYLYKDNAWYMAAGANVDSSSDSFNPVADASGIKLYWSATNEATNNGAEVSGPVNRSVRNGHYIVVEAPSNDGTPTRAVAGQVTVEPRVIYAFVDKTATLDKPYDGTAYADPSGLTFEFYDYKDNTTGGNDEETNGDFTKYEVPAGFNETLAIAMASGAVEPTGNQLKAEYLGATNGSHKLEDGSWVVCDMRGKDVRYDASGTVISKTVQLSNLHLANDYNGNYTLANADTWSLSAVTPGFDRYHPSASKDALDARNQVNGTISPKALSVVFGTLPAVARGTETTPIIVDLSTPDNYTFNGKVDGDDLSGLVLTAKYTNRNTAAPTVDITTTGKQSGYDQLNYTITVPDTATGTTYTKGISALEITESPDKTEYTHGDSFELEGTEIKITYNDDSYDILSYEDGKWSAQSYTKTGEEDGTLKEDVSLGDYGVTLKWDDNTAAADEDTMKYHTIDTADDEDATKKKTHLNATAEGVTPATSDKITVAKRQIALTTDGNVTKVYDGNNTLNSGSQITTNTLVVAVVNADGTPLPTAIRTSVSFNTEGAKNAGDIVLKSLADTNIPDAYVGAKDVELKNISSYIGVGTNDDPSSYDLTTINIITDEATGTITQREITITPKLPTLDLSSAKPDEEGGTVYTITLSSGSNPSGFTIEKTDGVGVAIIKPEATGKDEVVATWDIIFDLTGMTIEEATKVTIAYRPSDEGNFAAVDTNDTLVTGNYLVHWVKAGTEADVTPIGKVTIEAEWKGGEFNHGDEFDPTGLVVTVTPADGEPDVYEYTEDGWTKNGEPLDPDEELPFDLFWTDKDGEGDTPVDGDKLLLDDPVGTPDNDPDGDGKDFHITVRPKDPGDGDTVDIPVKKLLPVLQLTGKVTKVYDKTKDITDYSGLTAALVYNGETVKELDIADIINMITAEYAATTSTPASYVGTSTNGTKAITVNVASNFTVELGNDAEIYKMPKAANVDGVESEITVKPVTFVVTADSLATFTYTDDEHLTRTLGSAEYEVYEGENVTSGASFKQYLTDDSVSATWVIAYSNVTINPKHANIATVYDETKLTGDAAGNYAVTWILPEDTDKIITTADPHIDIIGQPKPEDKPDGGDPEYGDKPDWEDFEYEVTYPDGTKKRHKWDKDNNKWSDEEGYEEPDPDTTFKWGDTEVGPDDFKDIVDGTLDVGDNQLTITVPNPDDENTPITDKTDNIPAGKRKLTIRVEGLEDKVYDGTSEAFGTPSIIFENIAEGDNIPTAGIEVEFVDENVARDASGAVIPKRVIVKGLSLEELADKYEITNEKDENVYVSESNAKITPRPIHAIITATSITTSTTNTTVSKTGVAYSETAKAGAYTLSEGSDKDKELVQRDSVTLKYSGTYADKTEGKKSTVDKTGADRDKVFIFTDGPTIEDPADANNYEITYDIEYTVSKASSPSGPSGPSGGGPTLTVHYENEDGTAGAKVTKIEVQLGTEPTDLIGVISPKIKDMTVLWSSSDESIVKVDENGILTYLKEGKVTITAVSQQNKSLKGTVEVTVTAAPATPVPTPEPSPEPLITGEMLNPYIVGYDNYVFGPELPISREELSAIFARLIANNIYMDKDYDTSFPDVPETWSKTYIGYLEGFNIVTGYEDGTFRPHNYITRAEMAVMMAKAEGYDISGYVDVSELAFPDIDEGYSTWAAAKAIKILTDRGIMQGYTDGTFRPGQPITRAETVATVNRVLADQALADIEILPSDVTDAHWAYNDIVFAMNHRVLKDTAADPNKFVWSEQFDKNIIKTDGAVDGMDLELATWDEIISRGGTYAEDADADTGDEGDGDAEDDTSPDAIAPETTDPDTDADQSTTE